ncbi:MAG: ubiquinol-cytochrome c reductase iron-sulfur subunit, partial [Gemmatimonadota bacterium]
LAGCGLHAAVPAPVERGRIRLRLSNHPRLAERDGFLKVRPDGASRLLYILSTEDGFVAVSPVCTHQGCTVDVEGSRLVCPCHGSEYERTGRVLRGPAERSLERYPVELPGDGTMEVILNRSAT